MRVLIAEDEIAIRRLVREGLEHEDIAVTEAGTLRCAMQALRHASFDVVILDLGLPDGSAIDVIEHLEQTGSHAHVIVLSASGEAIDRVGALALGADDYVGKPFFARELVARVLAVQRRRGGSTGQTLRVGPLEIDLGARRIRIDGAVVPLTDFEFALLTCLAMHPGHTFARRDLLRCAWPQRADAPSERTVRRHIAKIRAQIEADPSRPRLIQSVRGIGYRFSSPLGDDCRAPRDTSASGIVGSWILVDGRIVQADAAAAALVGADRKADLVGRRVMDLVAPSSQRAAAERLELVAAGIVPRSQILVVSHRDGVETAIDVTSSEVQWRGQRAHRSEIRHAIDQSLGLRQLMTGVLADVSDAVIVIDLQSHIRSWNHAAERLYGWTETVVLGHHLLDIIPPIDADHLEELPTALLQDVDRWHGLVRQRTRLGATIAVRSTMNLVRDEECDPIGIVLVNRPATPDALELPNQPTVEAAADLRRALHRHEFEVYYQPVVDLADRSVITVEALVRWHHPDRGLLGPGSFIEVAEQSGAILELGAFILREACRQTAKWRRDGAAINLAVNISARELADRSLAERISKIVDATGLDPRALWLEVTEGSLVEDRDMASVILEQLAARGIGISIDDFGTGWASLTYLRQFPVNVLKIDRSFVCDVDRDPSNVAIARSILSLGAELGLAVVAEGIETIAEERTLRALGCTIGQGFLYGRPTPAAQVDLSRMHRREAAEVEV